jgi:uncharacterized protein (TIGR02466 family)|tara:strand:- start:1078 stop:1707 length:630 start_codon:yes stop_codon:yes gene_type:complete
MNDTFITELFATPVYISKIKKKFTQKELNFFKKSKLNLLNNEGNNSSKDSYILNNKELDNLNKELLKKIKDYFNKVLSSTKDVEPYITQSWLNYTEKGQYHHKHAHPNSIISGIFYINADKKNDKVIFFKNHYQQIKLNVINYNNWNSETWCFPVETGKVMLFPSSLNHMVETKKGTNTRISLSFNVFVKGNLGNERGLTELLLKDKND